MAEQSNVGDWGIAKRGLAQADGGNAATLGADVLEGEAFEGVATILANGRVCDLAEGVDTWELLFWWRVGRC